MKPFVKCLVPIPLLILSSCAVVPTIEFFVDSDDLTLGATDRTAIIDIAKTQFSPRLVQQIRAYTCDEAAILERELQPDLAMYPGAECVLATVYGDDQGIELVFIRTAGEIALLRPSEFDLVIVH